MLDNAGKHRKKPELIQKTLFEVIPEQKQPPQTSAFDDKRTHKLLVTLFALEAAKGVGVRTLYALVDAGHIERIWDLDLDQLNQIWSQLPLKAQKDAPQTIYDRKHELLQMGERAAEELKNNDIVFLPKGHPTYPKSLYKLQIPPRWIFVKGNLEAINSTSIAAVIGTRTPSNEGLKLAYLCAKELVVRNIIVLSGLAKGIDEQAHLGAVEYYGQTIGILGHGMNTPHASVDKNLVYKILSNDGAIVTEYLPSTAPTKQSFLRRNELQAAMSQVVIPVENPSLNSGTSATIRRSMNLKTPVVGIIPPNTTEPTLLETKSILTQMGHPVFTVLNNNSKSFWEYLENLFPDHSWNTNSQARQDRSLRDLEKQFIQVQQKVPFDYEAVERFAKRLKQILAK